MPKSTRTVYLSLQPVMCTVRSSIWLVSDQNGRAFLTIYFPSKIHILSTWTRRTMYRTLSELTSELVLVWTHHFQAIQMSSHGNRQVSLSSTLFVFLLQYISVWFGVRSLYQAVLWPSWWLFFYSCRKTMEIVPPRKLQEWGPQLGFNTCTHKFSSTWIIWEKHAMIMPSYDWCKINPAWVGNHQLCISFRVV